MGGDIVIVFDQKREEIKRSHSRKGDMQIDFIWNLNNISQQRNQMENLIVMKVVVVIVVMKENMVIKKHLCSL